MLMLILMLMLMLMLMPMPMLILGMAIDMGTDMQGLTMLMSLIAR